MIIDSQYINSAIARLLPINNSQLLIDMSNYSLGSGGKRVRPLTLLKTAMSFGGVDSNIDRLAVALECVHTFSLVHDDLPVMDNDDVRRGIPTTHVKYGQVNALLCGDYLLNCSMEILARGGLSSNYLACIAYLYSCSANMIDGQILDIEGNIDSIEKYINIVTNKTSALLRASIVIPAIYYNIDSNIIAQLEAIADNAGIIYQIADDLDEEKIEYTSILSIVDQADASSYLTSLIERTLHQLSSVEKATKPLPHIRELIIANTKYNT